MTPADGILLVALLAALAVSGLALVNVTAAYIRALRTQASLAEGRAAAAEARLQALQDRALALAPSDVATVHEERAELAAAVVAPRDPVPPYRPGRRPSPFPQVTEIPEALQAELDALDAPLDVRMDYEEALRRELANRHGRTDAEIADAVFRPAALTAEAFHG